MYPYPLPIHNLDRDEWAENVPPEAREDLERDRKGTEDDSFDTESAGYMDKEGVIVAKRRTEYAPGQTGCGSNFSSEANKPRGGKC